MNWFIGHRTMLLKSDIRALLQEVDRYTIEKEEEARLHPVVGDYFPRHKAYFLLRERLEDLLNEE